MGFDRENVLRTSLEEIECFRQPENGGDGGWEAVMIIRKAKVEGETRATCYIMKFKCQPNPSPDIARRG